ncbi:MAG: hypothetical protein JWQ07_5902 [Ramlibacter sp.]|nr:hypothetical protein [Ramlibacter sp.]
MDEDGRQHLDFIQNVIARQASNSFLVKGWALTVATATFAFAVKERAWLVAVVGVLAVCAFWYLDAFFLRQERLYRCVYEAVIDPADDTVRPYSMVTTPFMSVDRNRWPAVITSRALLPFFVLLILTGSVSAAWSHQSEGEAEKRCRTDRANASSSAAGVT